MSIDVASTTDTQENIENALVEKEVIEVKPEALKEDEIVDDSENLEDEIKDDIEEKEEIENTEKPKKKSGFKKRIDKLNGRISAKEQEVEYWKEQALKANNPKKETIVENEITTDERPDVDDYEDHDDYVEALTDWKLDEKLKARDLKHTQAKMKTEQQTQVQSFQAKNQEFAKSKDDYQDVIEDVDHIKMSLTVQEVIVESDNGPELMYELAKHSEEYERICRLPPIKAAQALGRFENKYVKSEITDKKIKTSKAPKPISTISGKGASSSNKSIYDVDTSQRDFERMRNEQLANRNY